MKEILALEDRRIEAMLKLGQLQASRAARLPEGPAELHFSVEQSLHGLVVPRCREKVSKPQPPAGPYPAARFR